MVSCINSTADLTVKLMEISSCKYPALTLTVFLLSRINPIIAKAAKITTSPI